MSTPLPARARAPLPIAFAAARLRNRSNLRDVVQHCQQALREFIGEETTEPFQLRGCSAPSISRRQLWIDASFCLHIRDALSLDTGPLYVWADSSPQVSVDWLLSVVTWVKAQDVVPVFEAWRVLKQSVMLLSAGAGEVVAADLQRAAQSRDRRGRVLLDSIKFHKQLPVALGSGAASVEYKVKCLLQKFWAEAPAASLMRRLLPRLRGCCCGMGTELKIPDYSGAMWDGLLPRWVTQQASLMDDIGADDDGQVLASSHTSEFLLPECLVCAGTCHIFHNLAAEVDTHMSWFPTFLQSFDALVYLLHHDHLRRRLQATLFLGTRFEPLSILFEKTCPKHAKWRWASLGKSLQYVLGVRKALQAAWGQQRFQGVNCTEMERGLDEEDKARWSRASPRKVFPR